MRTLLKNGFVLRDALSEFERLSVLVEDDRIKKFCLPEKKVEADETVDCKGKMIIPGMIQTHVHFCQVLFRGLADDLPLLAWLKQKIWPMEAAHDGESTYLSAMVGAMELIAGGVTTVCDMESVRHADQAACAIRDSGIRAVFGKVLMDYNDTPEELGGMPASFFETTDAALASAMDLYETWHGRCGGRIQYAFMPRGILTTTEELLRQLAVISEKTGCIVHTHACETLPESKLVEQRRGKTEIKYLNDLGLANQRLLLAHCLCIDEEDIAILHSTGTGVASCPIANLKLGSGIAPLDRMQQAGIRLSLGSDGAPCNNALSMFQEMKFASLLQKGTLHKPTAMTARDTFRLATEGGAEVLGLGREIGTLAPGKKADLAVLDPNRICCAPVMPSLSTLVYSGVPQMVSDVMIDGKWVYRDGSFPHLDEMSIIRQAGEAQKRVITKIV